MPTPNPLFTADGASIEDTYQRVLPDEPMPEGDVVLSVSDLGRLDQITGRAGVWLEPTDSPDATDLPLDRLALVVIDFPNFADGRGYSFATLLRRKGFQGELRAVGDVFKDVLFFLKRVGFTEFALKTDKDVEDAKRGLTDFRAGYQYADADPYTHYQSGRKL